MESIVATVENLTVEELEGVRRVCASLVHSIDVLLEVADDRTQSRQTECVAG